MSVWRYSLSTITKAVDGRVVGDGAFQVDDVSIDSRGGVLPTTLFAALKGPRHDGHDHIRELHRLGVRAFLVNEDNAGSVAGMNAIVVPDSMDALQRFAAWHRGHFNIPVIGITGSNGKTIVKEWLFQMLHREENIVRSPGSWNSQVGVPLSVLQMAPEHTLAIFEAGISQPGEMEKLEKIIRPTIGVLTNIGDAHDDGFGADPELKEQEKRVLFTKADAVLDERSLNVTSISERAGSSSIRATHDGQEYDFLIPFSDHASISNALTCISVCLHLGRSAAWINQRLAQLTPVDMRLRTMQGGHGTTLIDDSYSLDRSSLMSALDHLRRTAHGRDQVVVLSDVAEHGHDEAELYAAIATALQQRGVHRLIAVGPRLLAHRALFPPDTSFHPDVDALLRTDALVSSPGAVVLIKGARSFGFERIVERWQQQVHGTELVIDLEAIRHNLNHYRASIATGVRTMAMVKAFGYGSGALELARLFEHERVHYLGVAYADEGIELRTHGITMPIMVMNPEPVDMGTLHRFRLETEVYDQRSLREAITAAERMADAPPVHLKLDTGMHRLGFVERELPELLNTLRERGSLTVASILSHLVASEEPAQDDFTRGQIAAFTRMANAIGEVLGYKPLWHMANTAGIARWPEAHFDMVRVGIGLHGIGANAAETAKLMPTMTLRTPIAQLKQLTTGETVGYNRRGVITGDRTIATLPIGYADGLSRRLGNGVGRVWIAGKAAPIIGSVCMDMCMVDVTGINCSVGQMAFVFYREHPVSEVAKDMGTIPYEVLTSISQRVKRVYVRG
ncbi:MAG: alanine racemase [Flavobacteriales bacterium]|nr:alanine racemase [Flavobacteriales bacterium]